MSIGIAYNPCKNCKEIDKCSICELTYYRKGYIKSPTADVVEVRSGHWEEENRRPKSSKFICSVCGELAYYIQPSRDKTWKKGCHLKYCPNCGAKMDWEKRSENEG